MHTLPLSPQGPALFLRSCDLCCWLPLRVGRAHSDSVAGAAVPALVTSRTLSKRGSCLRGALCPSVLSEL